MQRVDRIIRGTWQLAHGHRIVGTSNDPLNVILDAAGCGFRVFDCADIYQGAEELLGRARSRLRERGCEIRVHTKFVPDRDCLGQLRFEDARAIVERSLRRLQVECLDLVQFHWWDYKQPGYLEALGFLRRLQTEGKLRDIGLTNFNTFRLREILDLGFPIASIQVQYSLVDRRPERSLVTLCQARNVRVLAYGTLLGGFASERWLGQPRPREEELANRSLVKYQLVIDDWGGWDAFQALLRDLARIAQKHQTSIAQVAVEGALRCTRADALIIGLGSRDPEAQNRLLSQQCPLDESDIARLEQWVFPLPGDVYELERSDARHRGIMKYNLNQAPKDALHRSEL